LAAAGLANAGLLSDVATITLGGPADNTGTLSLSGGTLTLTTGALTNSGDLAVHEGSALTTAAGFGLSNSATFNVDTDSSDGGSTVTVGGTLSNTATLSIGNGALSAPATVTAAGLGSLGNVTLTGGASEQATLDFTAAAAPTSLTGTVSLSGDALLEFASGSIESIAGALELGANARVADAGDTADNSALSELSSNAGTFELSGASVTTGSEVDFTNSGTVEIFSGSLELGGVLTNNAGAEIFIDGGTLAAAGLANAGLLSDVATITLGGPADNTGTLSLSGGTLTLTTGALTNSGDLAVHEGSALTTAAGFGLSNSATFNVDTDNSDGGSTVTVGGTLSNTATLDIGNAALSAPTTVTAAGLGNTGSINIEGGSTQQAVLTVDGSATTSGTITLTGSSELVVSSGNTFSETAGTTTVNAGGTLAAATIDVTGGVLDFTSAIAAGSGTGNFEIGGTGIVEFGGAVDAGHSITFTGIGGTTELGAPGQFAPTVDGFAVGDKIDLLQTAVTGLSYASGVLTVTNGSTTVASLNVAGAYSTPDFTFASDNNGGTDIGLIQNPATLSIAASSSATVGVGQPGSISGISIVESPTTSGESFTVTLSDAHGDLAAPVPSTPLACSAGEITCRMWAAQL
jgi:hypothetical protein